MSLAVLSRPDVVSEPVRVISVKILHTAHIKPKIVVYPYTYRANILPGIACGTSFQGENERYHNVLV